MIDMLSGLGVNTQPQFWVSVVEITIISIYFILPTTPGGVPWDSRFDWALVQYAPIALIVVVGGATPGGSGPTVKVCVSINGAAGSRPGASHRMR